METYFYALKRAIFLLSLIGLAGCYQIHSDDDLRDVPVTNNPNLVPATDPMSRFIAMP